MKDFFVAALMDARAEGWAVPQVALSYLVRKAFPLRQMIMVFT